MNNYFEVSTGDAVQAFEDFDAAVIFADKIGANMISEIGGNWTDFEKCWFCGEWFDSCELNAGGVCARCDIAIKDHCGEQ